MPSPQRHSPFASVFEAPKHSRSDSEATADSLDSDSTLDISAARALMASMSADANVRLKRSSSSPPFQPRTSVADVMALTAQPPMPPPAPPPPPPPPPLPLPPPPPQLRAPPPPARFAPSPDVDALLGLHVPGAPVADAQLSSLTNGLSEEFGSLGLRLPMAPAGSGATGPDDWAELVSWADAHTQGSASQARQASLL
jgi:hypothetical protein